MVVFDWYATLAAPSPTDFWERVPELIVEAGGDVDPASVEEWNTGHPLEHLEISSSEAVYRAFQRQRFEALVSECDVPDAAARRLVEDVEEQRYTRAFSTFEGIAEVLRDLRQRSYRIGICSNWDWDLDRHLRANGIDVLVDFVVCSAVVGYRKPHPAIFYRVLAGAGVPADQVLFVGDNWNDDIEGAARAGMQVMHVATGTSCADRDHGDVPCGVTLRDVVGRVDAMREAVGGPS